MVNSKFGEGIARGTVPLEKDDGVTRANRPASEATMLESHRGIENLKLA